MRTTILFTYFLNGGEIEVTEPLPAKWQLCIVCRGEGSHSQHIGAITESERVNDWTEEEFNGYLRGDLDMACNNCNGEGKLLVVDIEQCSRKQRRHVKRQCELLARLLKEAERDERMQW